MTEPTLTPEQEADAQRLAAIVVEKAKEEALRMARLLVSKPDHELLGATEFEIRERVHRIGLCDRSRCRPAEKRGYTGSSMTCPHCGESARFVEYRDKDVVSLLGLVRLSRGYYHCRRCHGGHFPWDEVLRLRPQRLSPGAEEVVCLAGIQESFGKAAGERSVSWRAST